MSTREELAEWKDQLEYSHKKFATIKKKIKRSWEYYKGNQWADSSDGLESASLMYGYREKTVDNVIYSNLRAIIPRLNFRNPKIFVRPKKKPFRTKDGMFDTFAAAVYVELILNHYYKVLDVKSEARKCLYDAFLSPWGIMELGYTFKTEKFAKKDELLIVNELVMEDSPFCLRRDPNDFRVDIEARDAHLHDARWIALRWVRPLDDVRRDPRFSNISGLKTNFRVKTDFGSQNVDISPGEYKDDNSMWGRVEGWDIWDKKTHRIMTLVDGHDKFLRNDKEWPLELEGFPVETLYFNENSTDIFSVPDIWMCLDMQDELNRIGSMQMDHIRRISQRRYIARETAFNQEELRKLTHGGDGTVVETAQSIADSIMPLSDATISQDIYLVRNGVKETIRQMMGVSASEAMTAGKFESATEPALIEQAAQSIRGDQQQIFERFLVRVIEKCGNIVQQTMDKLTIPLSFETMHDDEIRKFIESKAAKMVGMDGAIAIQPWLEVGRDDIKGEYIYELEIGSTMPVNEQSLRQDAVMLYKLLADNPWIKGREGTKDILTAFDKPDPEKLLKPDDQVEAEKKARAMAQIQGELALDTPKRQTDLAKTQMKTQTAREIAMLKARGEQGAIMADVQKDLRQNRTKLLTEVLKSQKPAGGQQ